MCEELDWKYERVCMEARNASTSPTFFLCLATVLITLASAELILKARKEGVEKINQVVEGWHPYHRGKTNNFTN